MSIDEYDRRMPGSFSGSINAEVVIEPLEIGAESCCVTNVQNSSNGPCLLVVLFIRLTSPDFEFVLAGGGLEEFVVVDSCSWPHLSGKDDRVATMNLSEAL